MSEKLEKELTESSDFSKELGDAFTNETGNNEVSDILKGSIEKILGLNEENLRSDGVGILKELCNEWKDLNEITVNDKELFGIIDVLFDSLKSILEKIENGEDVSFSDLMEIIKPLLKILLTVLPLV